MQQIYVIIPCYNEAPEVLQNTLAPLLHTHYNIVLIDDGSKVPIKDTLINTLVTAPNLHILRHAINLGQGAALQTGMDYAYQQGAQAAVHFDADGQHNYYEIPTLLAPILAQKADFVLGSRFINPEHIAQIPTTRRQILRIARLINFLFTGIYLTDAHNGFRALSRTALQCTQLTENRMAHATEILQIIKKSGLKYQEIPTKIVYTEYSKQKGQSSLNSINILLDLILKNIF